MRAACWAIRLPWASSRVGGRDWGRPCTYPCLPATSRSKSPHPFFTIPAECASMADAAIRCPPQVPAARWMTAVPPAMRFILHGDARARAAAAPIWGAAFAEHACRAVALGPRATLWLGPDEYLLLGADEEAADAVADALERAMVEVP